MTQQYTDEEMDAFQRATEIADKIVPKYRNGERSYSCTGTIAKLWQAAWDGAVEAMGHDCNRFKGVPSDAEGPA